MYQLNDYGEMIADEARMAAYLEALRGCVRPDSVVLDIGTGTGMFALAACRMGARRVFAIEPSDAIHVAHDIARTNGLEDRIQFFQDLSTHVTLPERADVIISDLRGILPLYQRHLDAIIDARRRHLAPGGRLIPRSDALWVAAVEAADHHASLTKPWRSSAHGLDMTAAEPLVLNTFYRSRATSADLATAPALLGTLDYATLDTTEFRAEVRLQPTRGASAHGLCVWFDSVLADGVRFSNAPGAGKLIYGSAFFPWLRPLPLEPGHEVIASMRAVRVGDNYLWTWQTEHLDGNGAVLARQEQSELQGELLSPATLRKQAASHVATLDDDGRIDALILRLMEDALPLGDIARQVSERYPHRFSRWQEALAHVAELSARYSR